MFQHSMFQVLFSDYKPVYNIFRPEMKKDNHSNNENNNGY